jgi:hypothetical protein
MAIDAPDIMKFTSFPLPRGATFFYFIVLIQLILIYAAIDDGHRYPEKYTIVKGEDGKFLLLVNRLRIIRILPDRETVGEFGFDVNSLKTLSTNEIGAMNFTTISKPVDSLKFMNVDPKNAFSMTADERMRNCIQKIVAVEPATFWTETYSLPGLVNPAIERWSNGETIAVWRQSLWDRRVSNMTGRGSPGVDKEKLHLGIGYSHNLEDPSTNAPQYDPRLLLMSDGTLVVTYTIEYGQHANFMMGFFLVGVENPSKEAKAVVLREGSILDVSSLDQVEKHSQKNWVPFEYQGRLLYILSTNPLHIVELQQDTNTTSGSGAAMAAAVSKNRRRLSSDNSNTTSSATTRGGHPNPPPVIRRRRGLLTYSSGATLKTVYRHESVPLPWKPWYGLPIRGGTPAIMVNGYYLSMFHTVAMFQMPFKLKTYFMGAVTFCPKPPFQLHSMSSHPIVKERFYDGEWVKTNLDYVVFPVGIVMDVDGKHILVSMGSQDKTGWIIKLEIEGLFASLDIISDCSSSGATATNTTTLAAPTEIDNKNGVNTSSSKARRWRRS